MLNEIPWLLPIHAAVGDRVGEMQFSGGWNGQAGELGDYGGLITVPATTIDAMSEQYGRPDVVLVDIEGFEGRALASATATLAGPTDWSVEVHLGHGLEQAGGSAEQILAFFPSDHFERFVHSDGDQIAIPLAEASPEKLRTRFFYRTGQLIPICHFITGEYPPDCGGVSDYLAALATRLAEIGVNVHVWCPGIEDSIACQYRLAVHRLPGRFGIVALQRLSRELNCFPAPRTLLVQYVPHGFGWKAMNVPLCLWLLHRRWWHGDDVRTLFHEVAFPFVRRPLHQNLIAIVNRIMAMIVLLASRRTYVSTLAWNPYLDSLEGRRVPREWTPIPSNVPSTLQSEAVAIRGQITQNDPKARVIGNFGAMAGTPRSMLFNVAQQLLNHRWPRGTARAERGTWSTWQTNGAAGRRGVNAAQRAVFRPVRFRYPRRTAPVVATGRHLNADFRRIIALR